MSRVFALVVLVGVSGCGGGPAGPSPVSTGTWGGDHVVMTVAAASSHLEFDCAHGEIPAALVADSSGRFTIGGTYVRERGGPIRPGETPDSHPAAYAGSVVDGRMTLTVRLADTGEPIGVFTLQRDAAGRIVKCL